MTDDNTNSLLKILKMVEVGELNAESAYRVLKHLEELGLEDNQND